MKHLYKALLFYLLFGVTAATAQRPQRFHKLLPPGNYSGITPLGNNRFAVVSDKAQEDGFYVFHMLTDTVQGRITEVENEGFRSCGLPNRDMEGICYRPSTNTVFISGEKDNEVFEYTLEGHRTGQKLEMPELFKQASHNYGIESLTYDARRHLFFITTEHPLGGDSLLRIQSFGDDLKPRRQYFYRPDPPVSRKHIYGVSELYALDDGRLLVLERQIRIPRLKLGSSTIVRIYEVLPDDHVFLEKHLVAEFRTSLNLFSRRFANYEGLCQVSSGLLLLVADSQNRYKGVLRDWFLLLPLKRHMSAVKRGLSSGLEWPSVSRIAHFVCKGTNYSEDKRGLS
jgi:hypothetical protein